MNANTNTDGNCADSASCACAGSRTYIAIDLKSFYASCECVDRHLDPLTTNLVVADITRTEKTICLAVSPSLKAYGIPGRARLFEVVQRVAEVNAKRLSAYRSSLKSAHAKDYRKADFSSESFDAAVLAQDPSLKLSYIIAPPRMQRYEDISNKIYSVYLKYISSDDIIVYSIDEIFADVTDYLSLYRMSAHQLTILMIKDVLSVTGITATAGIGSNLYLAKVAMDIVAKHAEPDGDGVRIAELDEMSYRKRLWLHRPLTDFWRIGRGYSKKLEANGMFTMGDIARCSVGHDPATGKASSYYTEDLLFKLFGLNAEILIDHAWGYEPCTVKEIKSYKAGDKSLSSGQVLKEPYDYRKTELIVKEMTDLLVLDLVKKDLCTDRLVLTIGYDRSSITPKTGASPGLGAAVDQVNQLKQGADQPANAIPALSGCCYYYTSTGAPYTGGITADSYGRPVPRHAHGTKSLAAYSPETCGYTSSTRIIMEAMLDLFHRIIDRDLYSRRINVIACHVRPRREIKKDAENKCEQLCLFTDYPLPDKQCMETALQREKEHHLQLAILAIKRRYGKNALLKGMNLEDGGTAIERNGQIGGHRSG